MVAIEVHQRIKLTSIIENHLMITILTVVMVEIKIVMICNKFKMKQYLYKCNFKYIYI